MGSIRNIRAVTPDRVDEVHGGADPADRTQPLRTEQATKRDSAASFASANVAEAEPQKFPRTDRVSSSSVDSAAPLGPEGSARKKVADHFNQSLMRRWAGEGWASNRAIARMCGLNERVVRQWRAGDKSIPLAALLVLPSPLATELVTWIQDERALSPHRRGLPMLLDAVERLDAPVAPDEVDDLHDALWEIHARIGERIKRLSRERK